MQCDLAIGLFGFGAWGMSFYQATQKKTEVVQTIDDGLTITEYHTPYGTLTARDLMSEELKEAAGTGARVEYPFKSAADYDALQFLIEDTAIGENFEEYELFMEEIGSDGLALPFSGWLPAHQLMINYMGYQTFYYELHDHPQQLGLLIEALTQQGLEVLRLGAQSPAQAIEVGANYDEQMTPPPIFDEFFAPFYRKARDILESAGKILVVHGDGEMRVLLERLMACGIQVVEALTPEPMTSIDIASTRQLWNDQVTMWGGLATVILTEVCSNGEFESFLEDLFHDVAPGDRFILGFGDNVPTDAKFERIERIADFWKENGAYPLSS